MIGTPVFFADGQKCGVIAAFNSVSEEVIIQTTTSFAQVKLIECVPMFGPALSREQLANFRATYYELLVCCSPNELALVWNQVLLAPQGSIREVIEKVVENLMNKGVLEREEEDDDSRIQ